MGVGWTCTQTVSPRLSLHPNRRPTGPQFAVSAPVSASVPARSMPRPCKPGKFSCHAIGGAEGTQQNWLDVCEAAEVWLAKQRAARLQRDMTSPWHCANAFCYQCPAYDLQIGFRNSLGLGQSA